MATINLGRVKPVFRGAYAGGTAYVVDDIVTSGNETFICIQASTGNATSNASYWTKLAAKGTDGTDVGTTITTQGDILYRDGSGLARLAAGTSGQALITGGSGANPSWGSAGGVVQVKTARQQNTESWSSNNIVFGPTATITPTSASNKILVMAQCMLSSNTGTVTGTLGMRYATGSSVSNSGTLVGGGTGAGSRSTGIAWGGNPYQNWNGTNIHYHTLHAPNTTSQISYRFCQLAQDGGATMYVGRTGRDSDDAQHPRVDTNITLMEIDAGVL